jgi:hypothetical protein
LENAQTPQPRNAAEAPQSQKTQKNGTTPKKGLKPPFNPFPTTKILPKQYIRIISALHPYKEPPSKT